MESSLEVVLLLTPASGETKPLDTTNEVNRDMNIESDDMCIVREDMVSDEASSEGPNDSAKSGGATGTLEKACNNRDEIATEYISVLTTEGIPHGSKPSLSSFENLTNIRVQSSGAACSQYLVLADAPSLGGSSSAKPLLCASVRKSAASERCCSGGKPRTRGNQPFAIDVSDYASRTPVVRILCDQHGSATVESPPSEVIGYIKAERVVCSLWFTIRDLHGATMLFVKCNWYCDHQALLRFRILLPDESAEVAKLERTVGSNGAAPTSGAYSVELPESMGADVKAMLIGVTMLFDRNLFSQS